jgi:hypothetical protein
MVEIKHEPGPPTRSPPGEDDAKYRLVYAKSKVYVNQTAYARDNISGFVTIVKRVRRVRGEARMQADPPNATTGSVHVVLLACLDPGDAPL